MVVVYINVCNVLHLPARFVELGIASEFIMYPEVDRQF